MMHKITRIKPVWEPLGIAGASDTFNPLSVAEKELTTWKGHWMVDDQRQMELPREWLKPLGDEHPPLSRPTVEFVRKVCSSFLERTGIGIDRWHPR